jgi:methionyl-tRNA synthetase
MLGVQDRLVEEGHIYKGSHSGWYAVSDECFYTEQQIKDAEDGSGGKVSLASILASCCFEERVSDELTVLSVKLSLSLSGLDRVRRAGRVD